MWFSMVYKIYLKCFVCDIIKENLTPGTIVSLKSLRIFCQSSGSSGASSGRVLSRYSGSIDGNTSLKVKV